MWVRLDLRSSSLGLGTYVARVCGGFTTSRRRMEEIQPIRTLLCCSALPRAPSYLNSRLLGYVNIGYIVPSSHYLGNFEP